MARAEGLGRGSTSPCATSPTATHNPPSTQACPKPPCEAGKPTLLAGLDSIAPWLEQRSRDGFVRRVHGDLHLGNLCLWRGKPVLFDALEFDEAMATIDLGYDLAFLLMDLDQRVDRAAANRVLNRYVARTGDAELTRGLPVFLSLRAMVRAHVEAKRGNRAPAERYLDAATAYLRVTRPIALAIGGLPGSGKSTVARALAPELGNAPGALVLRSDEIRKRQHGVAPEQRLPQSAYSDAASQAVFAELAELVRQTAAGGHAVIADATFIDPQDRALVQSAAAAAGVPFRRTVAARRRCRCSNSASARARAMRPTRRSLCCAPRPRAIRRPATGFRSMSAARPTAPWPWRVRHSNST